MTDALDRSEVVDAGGAAPADDPPAARPETNPAHWMVAAAMAGAAAIHFAMAPSHIGESAIEGAGFVAAAWAQTLLAVALLWRPTRQVLLAVVAVNVALIGAWVVSRTAGLPFGERSGHAETVSLVDGVCVALEASAVLLALASLGNVAARVVKTRGLAIAGVVAAVAVTTGAVASPSARDHASGSHGEHAAAGAGAGGHGHDDMAAEDDLGFAALNNGHSHEAPAEQPLTDEERVTLARQLAGTATLVEKYPTLGAAEAAGWRRAGPFVPGLGVHYSSYDNFRMNDDGLMDAEDVQAPTLIFDGLEPEAPLAGFMYMIYGADTEPEGFAGSNDMWHYHTALCLKTGADGNLNTPFGADLEDVTEQMCTDVGGDWVETTGYMVHVWNVPGYESPDGMFHEVNRKITCPDGTYHKIPTKEIGDKDTVCRNP